MAAALRVFPGAKLVQTTLPPEPSPASVLEGRSAVFAGGASAKELELMAQHWAEPLAAFSEPKWASLHKLYCARLSELAPGGGRQVVQL